jgi:hypothetical protein
MGSLRPGRACSRVGMAAAFLNRDMTLSVWPDPPRFKS